MDIADKIVALAQSMGKMKQEVVTEEATKTAFVMPFLVALGYDVFDPSIVVPEFTADVGSKKGEKVDYAIKRDGRVVMLIECKPCKAQLAPQHTSQLFRYFSVTEARFGILTNGIVYRFFTDLDLPNKMDESPFFEFDMLSHRPAQIDELKKFANPNFDVKTILTTASDLKHSTRLMQAIEAEIDQPSDDFKKMLISRIHDGKLTANVLAKFSPLVHKAMKDVVRELVNQRLSQAMDGEKPEIQPVETAVEASDIVTTQEEIDGFNIVRAIVRQVVKVGRIGMRDGKGYCSVVLDDTSRKPICRMHFNRNVKCLGLIDADKNEERVRIDSLDDIFEHAERLKAIASFYDNGR